MWYLACLREREAFWQGENGVWGGFEEGLAVGLEENGPASEKGKRMTLKIL